MRKFLDSTFFIIIAYVFFLRSDNEWQWIPDILMSITVVLWLVKMYLRNVVDKYDH